MSVPTDPDQSRRSLQQSYGINDATVRAAVRHALKMHGRDEHAELIAAAERDSDSLTESLVEETYVRLAEAADRILPADMASWRAMLDVDRFAGALVREFLNRPPVSVRPEPARASMRVLAPTILFTPAPSATLRVVIDAHVDPQLVAGALAAIAAVYKDLSGGDDLVIEEGTTMATEPEAVAL